MGADNVARAYYWAATQLVVDSGEERYISDTVYALGIRSPMDRGMYGTLPGTSG
jgi:hypothetical protein